MARGGSRYGAGRPGWHVKAEHCRRIDARRWQREGILQPGRGGGWVWTDADTGKQTASIGYSTEPGAVVLNYTMNDRPMRQRVPILATPCHFGGQRQWFACPHCARRVAVLFLRANGFFCRRCNRIAYGSQSDDALGRTWRKQQKVEAPSRGALAAAEGHAPQDPERLHGGHLAVRGQARSGNLCIHASTWVTAESTSRVRIDHHRSEYPRHH